MSRTTYLAQNTDTSFLEGINAWIPDFMGTKLQDVTGVVMAICFIVIVIGGLMIGAGIAFARQDGRSDQVASRLLWWGGGAVMASVVVGAVQWLAA